jgi:hypothetical protein
MREEASMVGRHQSHKARLITSACLPRQPPPGQARGVERRPIPIHFLAVAG